MGKEQRPPVNENSNESAALKIESKRHFTVPFCYFLWKIEMYLHPDVVKELRCYQPLPSQI
jgi:hypothetical protein